MVRCIPSPGTFFSELASSTWGGRGRGRRFLNSRTARVTYWDLISKKQEQSQQGEDLWIGPRNLQVQNLSWVSLQEIISAFSSYLLFVLHPSQSPSLMVPPYPLLATIHYWYHHSWQLSVFWWKLPSVPDSSLPTVFFLTTPHRPGQLSFLFLFLKTLSPPSTLLGRREASLLIPWLGFDVSGNELTGGEEATCPGVQVCSSFCTLKGIQSSIVIAFRVVLYFWGWFWGLNLGTCIW